MRYNSEKSTCFGRCFFFLVLFRQVPDELDDMLRLLGRELAQEGLELAGLAGGFQLRVEEILGPDAEIVANAEKAGHGGQGPAVFDLVDIALALAQGQAHIPGGNALLHPELDQPLGEPLCVIHRYHLLHIL